jgi:predicted ATP-grasp superfamily ATP-dependent carboligase
MKRVLVLDANQRSALAVTRSLGQRGIPIITADESPLALAGASRYSISYISYPSPRTQPEKFIDFLVELVITQCIDIPLPMTELTTTLLLTHKSLFPQTVIPFAGMDIIETLADKCALMRRAETLEIPAPRTWYADHPTQLPMKLEDLPYPLVLKPGKSWLPRDNEWVRNSVRFADNPLNAKEILETDPAFQVHPFLLQECVSGSGQGIFALYDHGKPLAFFSHRRLREKPPSGGVSVLSESVAINPQILTHARKLLDDANWHGVAMVEFKVNEDDGTPYLMEVNTRFWGSLQLAIDAGVDFPWLLYQLACGEKPDEVDSYKCGTRLRWLLGDLDSLYLTLRDQQYSIKAKLTAILRFLTPSPFKTRHEVNRWRDLGPFWHELKEYLQSLTR